MNKELTMDNNQVFNQTSLAKLLIAVTVFECFLILLFYYFSVYLKERLYLYFGFRFILFGGAVALVTFDDLIKRKFFETVETGWSEPKKITNTLLLNKFSVTGSVVLLAISAQFNKDLSFVLGHISLYCIIAMIFQLRHKEA